MNGLNKSKINPTCVLSYIYPALAWVEKWVFF